MKEMGKGESGNNKNVIQVYLQENKSTEIVL